MNNIEAGGEQFVHCREDVHSSECPLSEVPLNINHYRRVATATGRVKMDRRECMED